MAMKSTGVVRQLDTLGRIVLPIELRRTTALFSRSTTPPAFSAATPATSAPTRASWCARPAWPIWPAASAEPSLIPVMKRAFLRPLFSMPVHRKSCLASCVQLRYNKALKLLVKDDIP